MITNSYMDTVLVRLDGMPEKALHDLLKKGIYKTKSEAIRAGLMKLYSENRRENIMEDWKKLQDSYRKNTPSFKDVLEALEDLEK